MLVLTSKVAVCRAWYCDGWSLLCIWII